ncbi:GNAT family N-acetyltransferase [Levilactobacillus huananensis]|uniref:GNAT family N-acetyltransferase n=1 Tax=Levilactobacillus huananensis TaxID=2486019 RepID=UPI000F7B5B59|nr:GNAT family N-acetyltransferase [Levilactobacillus huananensis]
MVLTYQRVTTPTIEENQLLLLADPSQRLIDSYVPISTVYAANDTTGLAGMVVLKPQEPLTVEIMALAVIPIKQRRGYGRALLVFAKQWAIEHGYRTVRIATGTTSLKQLYLYQQQGFRVVRVDSNYFTRNYSQSIIENGLVLRDRLILERAIVLPNLPIN